MERWRGNRLVHLQGLRCAAGGFCSICSTLLLCSQLTHSPPATPFPPSTFSLFPLLTRHMQAVDDFISRIRKYEEVYEPITDRSMHYIKLTDM